MALYALCAAPGCTKRCGWPKTRFCSAACVPHSVRVAAGRKGRQNRAFKFRMDRFKAELAQLKGNGGRMTAEDLLETFSRIERRGYMNGYQARSRKLWPKARMAAMQQVKKPARGFQQGQRGRLDATTDSAEANEGLENASRGGVRRTADEVG